MRVSEFRVKGYETLTKTASGGKNRTSATVFVPKPWAGRRVAVILLDDPDAPVSSE
jgi:hypothetical protein